jgi:hypothetical protein
MDEQTLKLLEGIRDDQIRMIRPNEGTIRDGFKMGFNYAVLVMKDLLLNKNK